MADRTHAMTNHADIDELQRRVRLLEAKLRDANDELKQLRDLDGTQNTRSAFDDVNERNAKTPQLPLLLEEYQRYGRQLILPEVGVEGQLRLKNSSVLITGAGGLGCPAAAYLAGAGVGTIGIVDGDVVEVSNLHRQILHTSADVGIFKADSVKNYIERLNPLVNCRVYRENIAPDTALGIMVDYDLVLDCTDNPSSRYLISDAAILLQKPVVSASALRTDGQLMILNHPVAAQGVSNGGPCYRCIFPKPPPPETVLSCGEGGILGPVVGTMGVMQALEAIKLLAAGSCRVDTHANGGSLGVENPSPQSFSMLLFSAYSHPPFRCMKMRGRRKDCRACSAQAKLSEDSMLTSNEDYLQFCGAAIPSQILDPEERVRPEDLAEVMQKSPQDQVIVDVREKPHFDVFNLRNSINMPYSDFKYRKQEKDQYEQLQGSKPIYIICRLGNDSQIAVKHLKSLGLDRGGERYIGDVAGGWQAWRERISGHWPEY